MSNFTGTNTNFAEKMALYDALSRSIDTIQSFPPAATVARITTATTTVASAVPCWVRLTVQGGTMGLVTVYDNTAASGQVDFAETPAAKDIIFRDWTYMAVGSTIVTAAATTILVEVIPA